MTDFQTRHYTKLAKIMANTRPLTIENPDYMVRRNWWELTLLELCSMLEQDNPRFDRQKFLEASEFYVNPYNTMKIGV